MRRKKVNYQTFSSGSCLTWLRKGHRLSLALTTICIAILIISFALVNFVLSPIPPIGSPEYLQSNPFESNPTNGATSGVVGLVGTIAYAKDGDLTTNLNWRIGGSTTLAYVQMTPFENAPPTTFSIGWIDIKVCYKSWATTDDKYRIVYQVGTSAWQDLQAWISGSDAKFDRTGSQDERVWSNMAEPNDGIWDWTDIGNLKVRVETQRVGTEDSTLLRFYLYEVWLTIYEGAYPATGPNLSIQPPLVHGLHAGDYFFVDVFMTNVDSKTYGHQFMITYNPYVLSAQEGFFYYPFSSRIIGWQTDTTHLHVDRFDYAKPGWTKVGTSPYLKNVDYPKKYVCETTDGSAIGDFSFSDIPSTNYGGNVFIELNATGDGDDQLEIWLFDGATWSLADTVTPPTTWPQPTSVILSDPWILDKYYDTNDNDSWDVGETAIRDNDDSGFYNAGVDLVLAGLEPPDGSPLTLPGARDRYYDADGLGEWSVNEPAIREMLSNYVYDPVDVVLVGPEPPLLGWVSSVDVGQILDTTAKINAAKVYLVKKTVGTSGEIIVDTMRLSLYTGHISMGATTVGPDWKGYAGVGPVARVYFKVVEDGMSPIHFGKSKQPTILGERITHTTTDGVFATWIRDISVKTIRCSPTLAYAGYDDINIEVDVKNEGEISETFPLTTYYGSSPIETKTVTLTAGEARTVTFTWYTAGVTQSNYVISASAGPVQYEFDLTDNSLSGDTITIRTPGNVNGDSVVDILDVSGISAHWYPGPPEGPLGYDSNFDVNNDGAIDILEISIISAYWTGPPKGPLDP